MNCYFCSFFLMCTLSLIIFIAEMLHRDYSGYQFRYITDINSSGWPRMHMSLILYFSVCTLFCKAARLHKLMKL